MLSFNLISNFFPFAFGPLMDSASLLLPLGVIKERSGQEEAVLHVCRLIINICFAKDKSSEVPGLQQLLTLLKWLR